MIGKSFIVTYSNTDPSTREKGLKYICGLEHSIAEFFQSSFSNIKFQEWIFCQICLTKHSALSASKRDSSKYLYSELVQLVYPNIPSSFILFPSFLSSFSPNNLAISKEAFFLS